MLPVPLANSYCKKVASTLSRSATDVSIYISGYMDPRTAFASYMYADYPPPLRGAVGIVPFVTHENKEDTVLILYLAYAACKWLTGSQLFTSE